MTMHNHSRQTTVSEGHRKNRKGSYDSGGPFFTEKVRVYFPSRIDFKGSTDHGEGKFVAYSGPVFPFPPGPMDEYFSTQGGRSQDTSDLDPYGATAISKCSPVNPVDTLGQGVSELYREGLPRLPGISTWEKRARIVKAAGSEFLNAVFGWKPLIGEVQDFARTSAETRNILKQYHENQGSNVHRTFEFPIVESDTLDILAETGFKAFLGRGLGGGISPPALYEWGAGPSDAAVYRITKTAIRRWFSGSFTYAVPSRGDSWRRMLGYGSDADKLFGIALTPELLWNLAPWSWAVDWFSNAGDVITNISNFAGAGQVMRYGYMMETKTIKEIYTLSRSQFFVAGEEIAPPIVVREVTSKVRRPANPYGFGLSDKDLSPLQLAIVAALGITLL